MHIADLIIIGLYIIGILYVGVYVSKRNTSLNDFFVGNRGIGPGHIGLSVVATDVGGGFSIGLGGLGFAIGISGSWMLFTGLLGAWISAVLVIPKVYKSASEKNFLTFPQIFGDHYNKNVALIAALISTIGYIGFTSSQVLAGAKLASASFVDLSVKDAVLIMGIIAIVYTALGGIKAVIYTDTVQWLLLIAGLSFIGIPVGISKLGGLQEVREMLPHAFFSFTNVSWQDLLNWLVTILPIWFIGMTLYQRIFASRSEKDAKKAWFIAGIFEYPIMAFLGVGLGMLARVAAMKGMFEPLGFMSVNDMDPEMGLPLFLRTALPVGFLGILLAAYFSAIMSTADSCLMAASGNVFTDILKIDHTKNKNLRYSQLLTLLLGILALFIALNMQNVLELMLYSYAFMVSGLFVPMLGIIFNRKANAVTTMLTMIIGGGTTVILTLFKVPLPYDLDANIFGILAAVIIYISGYFIVKK